jgi:hypothetical protein
VEFLHQLVSPGKAAAVTSSPQDRGWTTAGQETCAGEFANTRNAPSKQVDHCQTSRETLKSCSCCTNRTMNARSMGLASALVWFHPVPQPLLIRGS